MWTGVRRAMGGDYGSRRRWHGGKVVCRCGLVVLSLSVKGLEYVRAVGETEPPTNSSPLPEPGAPGKLTSSSNEIRKSELVLPEFIP